MQPTTPVLGVSGIQPPATTVPAGSGSLEPPNKRPRIYHDPLSRYEGYKRFMAHNKLYHDRMAQIAAEVAATLPQHLLLVSQAQLQCAGVEIVMSTSNTNHKYVIWPGMTVPPQPVIYRNQCHPSVVTAMMNDESFKQVLSEVPGVKTYTPEQAEQYIAHEKDKAAAQQAQNSAAVTIKQLEEVASLIASVKQLQHVQQSQEYRVALDKWSDTVNKHLQSLRSTYNTVSMMVNRKAFTADIRVFLESVTQEAFDWLSNDAQSVFKESLLIIQKQDSETRAHAASAETFRAEITQLKQQVTNLMQSYANAGQVAASLQQREQAALLEAENLRRSNAEAQALLFDYKQKLESALKDAHDCRHAAELVGDWLQPMHGRQVGTHTQPQPTLQTLLQMHQQTQNEQEALSRAF